jgi:crossover junction endodeoxyribonuclease RuvC
LRVVGVDPGSRITGWGVVEIADGVGGRASGPSYLASGRILAPKGEVEQRLQRVYVGISELLAAWSPTVLSVEKVFLAKNPQSALRLGEARGVILLAAAEAGVAVCQYSPAEIKIAITGYGAAGKTDVKRMVSTLLDRADMYSEDEADALAAALCCLYRSRFEGALAAIAGKRRKSPLQDLPAR